MSTKEVFESIKEKVHEVVPSATVLLFGSRASNTQHEESDWDILILEKNTVDRKVKRRIQDVLFPISLQIGSFINIVVTNEKEWMENPAYYSLRLSISNKPSIS